MRVSVLAAMLICVGCSSSQGGGSKLPMPACRVSSDCNQSGAPGATCVSGRCSYIGAISGSVQVPGPAPAGDLHIVAYPASAFMNSIGPLSGVNPVGTPVTIKSPSFPVAYQLSALPNGSLDVYAFISVNNKTQSDVRACTGDLFGVASLMILDGTPAQSTTNVMVNIPVNTTTFCQ